jgi:prepilin-type N-terminal cleavage/methylation domain-containing protein
MRIKERGATQRVPGEERGTAVALRSDVPPSALHLSASFFAPRSSLLAPRGMTLIELLIVIIILTTLVSAAIPLMSPTNDDRRLREASRAVNSFIAAAQARAIAIQRPVGVAIKRLSKDTKKPDDNAVSVELYYVEQPSPFVGFNEQSMARVALYPLPSGSSLYGGAKNLVVIQFVSPGTNTNFGSGGNGLPKNLLPDQFAPGVVRPGDTIVVNGTHYQLLSPNPNGPNDSNVPAQLDPSSSFFLANTGVVGSRGVVQIVAQPLNDSGQMIDVRWDNDGYALGPDRGASYVAGTDPAPPSPPNAPYWTNPASYKILRQPMKTSAEPLQLPEATAIDLRASGVGDNDYFYVPNVHDNAEDILIMFAPEGRVSRLAYSLEPPDALDPPTSTYDQPVVDNIILLIGRRENCPPPDIGGSTGDKTLNTNSFSTVPPPTEQQIAEMKKPVNWLRGESRWIVIGSQSGRVITVENAFVDVKSLAISSPTEVTRNSQILAAREFVKEMKQLGGR